MYPLDILSYNAYDIVNLLYIMTIWDKKIGGFGMIQYEKAAYDAMLGNITEEAIEMSVACMSQCTGCMCNCRCSCSGGVIADVEWEEM